jgi:hypothetical protein
MIEWRDGRRQRVIDDTRQMYGLAFVMLAGAHGLLCGQESGRALLEDAFATAEQHFWLTEHGLYADDASADWVLSSYRGQNPNMHACEAMLAAFEATGEPRYLARAGTLADSVVRKLGGQQGGRICEHYDTHWAPDWLYNRHDSTNIFRPWGYQPGHFTEWAKLLLQLDRFDPQPWHLDKARFLFDEASRTAWDHQHGGFHYGVGPDEQICDANKYHWVQAETLSAAALLAVVTGETLEAGLTGHFSRLRPSGSLHRPGNNLRGVNDGMLHQLALPCIGDVHETIGGLDDGGIAELSLGLILEYQRGLPGDAVLTDRQIERTASLGGVVINQEMTSVLQGHGISPGIRVRQVSEVHLRPS